MEKKFPKNEKGIALTQNHKISLKKSFEGVVCEAPTGAGKSSGHLIRQVLEWSGSMFVIDAVGKTSIYEATSGYKKKQGYKIYVIRLADPFNSDHKNPLTTLNSNENLREVANYFGNKVKSPNDPIWHEAASNIINVLLRVLKRTGEKSLLDLHNVDYLIKNFGVQGSGIRDFIFKTLDPESPNGDMETWQDFLYFITNLSPATQQGVLFSASTALSLWRYKTDNCSILTSNDTFDFSKIRKEKSIVYIILPKHKVGNYSTFLDLFFMASFEQSAKDGLQKGMLPLAYLLDEFGNLNIRNMHGYASVLRDYDISLYLFVQTQAQIYDNYGNQAARTIIANMRTRIFLSGTEDDTCEKVSKVLGKKTIQALIKDENGKSRLVTKEQDLMTPDQVRMIKENEAIVISSNLLPLHLKGIRRYYEDTVLKKYSQIPCYQKPFHYENETCFTLTQNVCKTLYDKGFPQENINALLPLIDIPIWGENTFIFYLQKYLEMNNFLAYKNLIFEHLEKYQDGRKKNPVHEIVIDTNQQVQSPRSREREMIPSR